jgi:hypothetical protein
VCSRRRARSSSVSFHSGAFVIVTPLLEPAVAL